jgi:hypothetical protein
MSCEFRGGAVVESIIEVNLLGFEAGKYCANPDGRTPSSHSDVAVNAIYG